MAQCDAMGRNLLVERVESSNENQLVNWNSTLCNIYFIIWVTQDRVDCFG